MALDLTADDEVIVPAFTFWSTAAAVLHHNALPVFVDIDPQTYTLDPAHIEEKITDRTKALFPVDIHGMPCDMDPIFEIARRHDLAVISDCGQAHGAKYKGKMIGSIADATAFSCNRSKNLSGGEGGLYTTDNEDWYNYANRMREFGEVVVAGQEREYNAYTLGWMYRPHEFISGRTPNEVYHDRPAANEEPRIEARPHWPTEASCATPTAAIDGEPGRKVELVVRYHAGRKHLPIVQLKRVA